MEADDFRCHTLQHPVVHRRRTCLNQAWYLAKVEEDAQYLTSALHLGAAVGEGRVVRLLLDAAADVSAFVGQVCF